MPSNRRISEPIGVNPKAITGRWVRIGGCAGVMGTAGTTGRSVKTGGAATATKIGIATGIVVDTAIGTIGPGTARTENEIIEPTMKIGLGGA
jgi:hypothetical protein